MNFEAHYSITRAANPSKGISLLQKMKFHILRGNSLLTHFVVYIGITLSKMKIKPFDVFETPFSDSRGRRRIWK